MATPPKRSTGSFYVINPADSTRPGRPLSRLTLQDFHEICLLLRGDSVIDWFRLAVRSDDDVRRLLRVNGFDLDQEQDIERLENLRIEAAHYASRSLGLRVDSTVTTEVPASELPLIASGRGKFQRQACVLLKVMHILYHLEARERRTLLPIADDLLFSQVERSVVELFEELRDSNVPVVEFAWSRKTKSSLVTKLLVKRDSNAAQVFDRLRFRLIVERENDVVPTINLMLHRFLPFNYIVPGQTHNTLLDLSQLERRGAKARPVMVTADGNTPPSNEFSGAGYQVLNFIADLPVRVDRLLADSPASKLAPPGSVVFVLTEFQVCDRKRAEANEQGERSHAKYKHRQHQRVRERLLRGPKRPD